MKKQMKIQATIETVKGKQCVSIDSLLSTFTGLSKTRLRKALHRLEAMVYPAEGKAYYAVSDAERALTDIATRRPFIESVREDYYIKPQPKAKKKIKLISAETVSEWYRATEYVAHDYPAQNQCSLDWEWHDDFWIEKEEKQLATFLKLSDEINEVLWQVDNSVFVTETETFGKDAASPEDILRRLYEYNLISLQKTKKPEIRRLLAEFKETMPDYDDFEDFLLRHGMREQRYDLLAFLEVGKQKPVNRREYWHETYSSQLGSPKVNYWTWLPNPESKEICDELTALLSLPMPSLNTRAVLEVLGNGVNPFEVIKRGVFDFHLRREFDNYAPERRAELRTTFREWHNESVIELGEDMMRRIYQRCYNTSWNIVEEIIQHQLTGEWYEVLDISPNATADEAKKAYKKLAKLFHPDINPQGQAAMQAINKAYEVFKKMQNMVKKAPNTRVA